MSYVELHVDPDPLPPAGEHDRASEWRTWEATPAQRKALRQKEAAKVQRVLRHRRGLGQIDPTPPPTRPANWLAIAGWIAVVGVTLAIFGGTVNMQVPVRRNRQKEKMR